MPSELDDPDRCIVVMKLEPQGLGNPLIFRVDEPNSWARIYEEIRMHFDNECFEESIVLTKSQMRIGDFVMLPEHQGW
jgi:hypothetical protein